VFFIPPIVTLVVVVLMNLGVKNTPEEAGFTFDHHEDDEPSAGGGTGERIRLIDVFRKIASNPVVWYIAGAYFCTGFVRGSITSWWSSYIVDVWHEGKESSLYSLFAWGLPITATVGSMMSGFISDTYFGGRRAPVAMALYLTQALLTLVAIIMPHGGGASPWTGACLVIFISMICNSTHSILGTAAAMDLGGRKMAGCSSGIIDSFQYYGSMLSGYGVGLMFTWFAWQNAATKMSELNPTVWFVSMLPFGVIGAGLMMYVWLKHGRSGALGT
jgi:OPA family glycerol-3-phosphate transporter-like MFS transporter